MQNTQFIFYIKIFISSNIMKMSLFAMFLLPELLQLSRFPIWLHCLSSWFPFSWANFAVFISKHVSLHKSENLIWVSSYR